MKVLPLYLPFQGCKHQCVYCNQPLTVGTSDDRNQWNDRLQSIKYSSIQSWEIAFYSGTFTALPQEHMDDCFAETAQSLQCESVQGYRISTRPDRVSNEILQYLKQKGVTTIELGIESLDDNVLRKSARCHTADDARDACTRVKQYGFKTGMHLMCGLPGQTESSWHETVHEVIGINPDCVRIAPTIILKDTPLEKLFLRGDYQPLNLQEAINQSAYAYQCFIHHNIKVIRVGLALSDEQGCGEDKIVGGPWHPALRHEVETQLAYQAITQQLTLSQPNTICINPKDISIVNGTKKCNRTRWKQDRFDVKIVQDDAISRHTFSINGNTAQPLFGTPSE